MRRNALSVPLKIIFIIQESWEQTPVETFYRLASHVCMSKIDEFASISYVCDDNIAFVVEWNVNKLVGTLLFDSRSAAVAEPKHQGRYQDKHDERSVRIQLGTVYALRLGRRVTRLGGT